MFTTHPLSHRALAVLRAVAAGRAELTLRFGPNLRIDGLHCTDQFVARHLLDAGLVRAASPHAPTAWVRAVLTARGYDAITPRHAAAA
jgi:hypothetical protein